MFFIAGSCANIGFLFVYLIDSQVAGTFHDNSIGHIKMNYVVSRLLVITNKEVLFFSADQSLLLTATSQRRLRARKSGYTTPSNPARHMLTAGLAF